MAKTCKLHKGMSITNTAKESKAFPQANSSGNGHRQKGVHQEYDQRGESMAGIRGVGVNSEKLDPKTLGMDERKGMHRKVLAEMKTIKPNLGKAEHSSTCKKSLNKSEEVKHDPQPSEGEHDPCPYCADSEDNRTDDCAYCQDLDAEENADGTAGMHDDCPACQEYDAANQETGKVDEDCPYCDDETVGQATAGEAATDMGVENPDNCPECQEMYSQAIEEQPGQTGQGDPNLQGHQTAEEVLGLLDQEPGSGPSPAQEASKIDNTEMPQGDAMEDGTSVTEDFGGAQKGDISDSEKQFQEGSDQPDMAGVLQNGLEDHANEQKKQQVLDMVGQTLAGFKANKASLEATKEQNQALYNSCIQMLKSMIALCDLLGLKPQAQPAQEQTPQPMQPEANAPAAPAEGAAQDPKI